MCIRDRSYTLDLETSGLQLRAKTYVGFLRGIETFAQLVYRRKAKSGSGVEFYIPQTPIMIADAPVFAHRGLMLDTSRHFFSKETLKKLLDGLMFSKFSVFHWHLTDDDSYPMQLDAFPTLFEKAVFSPAERYTKADMKEILDHGRKRGLRIIPEIESPGHARSWSLDPSIYDIVTCPNGSSKGIPHGYLDPTMNRTYEVVGTMFKELFDMFPDEFVHVAGDEVEFDCWKKRQSIVDWMAEHNVSDFVALSQIYQDKQREVLKSLDAKRTLTYWIEERTDNMTYKDDDVLQTWGTVGNYSTLVERHPRNKWIISANDHLYLDCGTGNYFGGNSWCEPYKTWWQIYNLNLTSLVNPENILGAEAALWSELVTEDVLDAKLWPRLVALSEATWTPEFASKTSVARRLNAFGERLRERGYLVNPITAQWCEMNIEGCF
eukprot:TRINITY_DN13668_c0_g1_i1.p1 TRINITY_DN13668_c0_g1~~TRINITY_DN13668_c0_g1_i1.p1  ORF type:complete len:435 (-),score=87.79 TRINITY_DN13668_c0_g1_i1:123-1427(-)